MIERRKGEGRGQDRRKGRGEESQAAILEADTALDGSRTLKRHCTD